jgi:nucleoside-diphosphate-sugar epimerase
MSQKKILITGGNGLLGSNLIKALSLNYKIIALVRILPEIKIEQVDYYACDFETQWDVDALPTDIFAIIHLAQSEKFRDFPNYAIDVFNVNVFSTVRLLDFAKKNGVKKFIFSSTGGVYKKGLDAVSENTPINTFGTLGNYLATKFCAEILMHNYSDFFDVLVLRIFFMYGEGQNNSMLIPRLAASVKNGTPIKINANGGIKINPIHVKDVVNLFPKILELNDSLTFNVAGPEVLTIRDIAQLFGKEINKEPIFEYTEDDNASLVANIDLLCEKLSMPKTTLEDSLSEILDSL